MKNNCGNFVISISSELADGSKCAGYMSYKMSEDEMYIAVPNESDDICVFLSNKTAQDIADELKTAYCNGIAAGVYKNVSVAVERMPTEFPFEKISHFNMNAAAYYYIIKCI